MNSIRDNILDGTPADIVERYESLPSLADKSDFGRLDSNVVVIDTETTGLSFNHDELIQIAAAKIIDGDVAEWFVTFVNPGQPIPEEIVHLTSICDEDVKGAPSPGDALAGLVEFVGDAIVVAHNVGFDKTFVTRHPEGYPLLENTWVDSLDLSRIALPRLRSHRLIDLVRTFGAPQSTHRADDDVAATCVIFRILLAAVSSMPLQLVEYIAGMCPADQWSTGEAFRIIAGLMGSKQYRSTTNTISQCPDEFPYKDNQVESIDVSRETSNSEIRIGDTSSAPGDRKIAKPEGGRPLFSLRELRRKRIVSLPTRPARKDAGNPDLELSYPSAEQVEEAFSVHGALGSIYPEFEPREEQVAMAQAIRKAFEASENLVVEAGTGVGKSMAYLVPAVMFARENGVAVGVATKTNSLLDQLVYKELPALAEALQRHAPALPEITWAALKGATNYPCLRKVARLADSGPEMKTVNGAEVSQAPALAALLSFVEQSEFDDLDALKIDYRALPRYSFTTKSSECLKRKCPYFGKLCFVHGARRRAETADVIVTNHTLLFCDLRAEGSLLPTVRHWVIDEAHSTEDEARRAFAQKVDSEAVSRIASRVRPSASGRNLFERAERSLVNVEGAQVTLFLGLMAKAKSAGADFADVAADYLARVKDLLYFDPVSRTRRGQSYEQVDVWVNAEVRHHSAFADVRLAAHELIEKTDRLISAASDVVAYLEGVDEAAVAQRDIASCVIELRDIRNAAELFFETAPENYAYQATLFRKKDRLSDSMQAMLLDVGEKMDETLFASSNSVVFASATLTVGGTFESFENAVGLNRSEHSRARSLELASSFDFDNNMIIYVASDMPEPSEPSYLDRLNDLLVAVHRAQQGSMLTLFTNRREMERSHEVVSQALKADGLRIVCQRYGVSVKGLRDDFIADEHLSLFALKSFWQGFDAPGSTLKGVVIPKLPFARPTDPLYRERAARDDRAWWRYVLPQAVIDTKQAAGRLIRKADDHGVLILADKRLVTKRYGKTFLRSLQSKTVRVCTIDEIVASLEAMCGW